MAQRTPPWLDHPPGVWSQQSRADGSSALVEFGGETSLYLRAWRREVGVEALGPAETRRVGGRAFELARPREGQDPPTWRARAEAGDAVVELALADTSGLAAEGALALLERAWACIDFAWIAARAHPPQQIAISADNLLPWPIHPTHAMASSLSCRVLPNGLGMGVAAVEVPWASVVSPAHMVWAALGAERLLAVATLNLIRTAIAGEIPAQRRSVRDVHAFVIGPHPLAVSCLMLPDLALWAEDALERAGPLRAVPLEPQVLLVAPEQVAIPRDAWAAPLRLPLG